MSAPPPILDRLVAEARRETEERRRLRPVGDLEGMISRRPACADLAGALRRPGALAVIAEMKSKSPTMGESGGYYSPAQLAWAYDQAGAASISVLCQRTSFGGSPDHLAEARGMTTLPLIRKDFVTDDYQVLEGRALGADAILLIGAILEREQLRGLLALTRRLGMEALVEVHEEAEAAVAVEIGATVIGVNHRDLRTFAIDLDLTPRLRPLIPADRVLVAESGVGNPEAARRLRAAGADAILVGEALMRATDPGRLLRDLAAA